MLDVMRRHASSWVVKVILGVITLVFIFFMGGGGQLTGGGAEVAMVDDHEITLADFQRAQSRNQALAQEQYGERLTPELMRLLDIPAMSLSQLVDQTVLETEAQRLGLRVPDDTLRLEIREIGAFQREGQFSPAAYRAALERQGMTPAVFEGMLRQDLMVEQLVDVVRRGVHVTEREAFDAYARDAEAIVLEYVKVAREKLLPEVTIDEAAVTAFFDAHQEEYRIPEAVRLRYLAYDPASFADPKAVSEEEVEEYYELNRETEFTSEETIGARHILKRAGADADAEVKTKTRQAIEKIAERLASGADFEQIAREESEDPGSATQGGDLGSFGRGRMVQPFEEAAFALQPGQISGVVESDFGYHIIRVYERKPGGSAPLEEVREKIGKKLAEEQSTADAFDAAAADALAVREGAELEKIASSRSLTVKATPPLSRGGIVPDIGTAPQLIEAALALKDKKDVTDPIAVAGKHYVVQLEERIDSFVPTLADVREKVEEAYRKEQATELARGKATSAMDELKAGKTPGTLSEASGYEAGETKEFTRRGGFVPGLGNVPGLKELAFQSAQAEVLPRAFVFDGNAYAFVVKERKPAEREEFDKVKESRVAALRRTREQAAVVRFVGELRKRTEIVYNQALLEQMMPQQTASAAP